MSLLINERHGPVAVLQLNDPDRRNILSGELCRLLSQAVRQADADPEVKAIVVAGTPPGFCAGADLEDLVRASKGEIGPVREVYRAFLDVAEARLPTIAAIDGAAVGAGFNLALACDVRIAAAGAKFEARFLKLGIHPAGGHGWMLQRAIGYGAAARLLLFNQTVDAMTALGIGLVHQVCPAETLLEQALALAAATTELPRDLLIETKQTLREASGLSHAEAVERETAAQLRSLGSAPFQDLLERVRAGVGGRRR